MNLLNECPLELLVIIIIIILTINLDTNVQGIGLYTNGKRELFIVPFESMYQHKTQQFKL